MNIKTWNKELLKQEIKKKDRYKKMGKRKYLNNDIRKKNWRKRLNFEGKEIRKMIECINE